MSQGQSACWCAAKLCSHQVTPGRVLCATHALRLARLDAALSAEVSAIDPRGIFLRPAGGDTIRCLETIAQAVEALAPGDHCSPINTYRLRAANLKREGEP